MTYQRGAKVILGGETLIDLTDSTVTAADLRDGITAYDKSGQKLIGELDTTVIVTGSGTATLISGDDYKITFQ